MWNTHFNHPSVLAPCNATMFRCYIDNYCIDSTLACNSVSNCASDNSDENGCIIRKLVGYSMAHCNLDNSFSVNFRFCIHIVSYEHDPINFFGFLSRVCNLLLVQCTELIINLTFQCKHCCTLACAFYKG